MVWPSGLSPPEVEWSWQCLFWQKFATNHSQVEHPQQRSPHSLVLPFCTTHAPLSQSRVGPLLSGREALDLGSDEGHWPPLWPTTTSEVDNKFRQGVKMLSASCSPNKDDDSIPWLKASFYKFFWINMKDMVMASFNEAFQNVSQRRAVITLIHNDKKLTKDELNNWRPISLTNKDYKILAKALAFRLQGVISELICEDQVGYIKGRNTSTIRLIDDVIEYIRINNKSGVIVALDYSKTFDSMNKKSSLKHLILQGLVLTLSIGLRL